MDLETILEESLKELIDKLGLEYSSITITEEEEKNFLINVISDNPSHFIGYHGDNIYAMQHILKILAWQKSGNQQFNILLDIDSYRQRQEENVISLAQRKIDQLRKDGRPQSLPAMSPYLRRKVHLYCMGAGMDDVETFSKDEADRRHIVLKLKS